MRDKIIQKAKIIGTMNYYEIIECPVRATQKEIHFSYMNLGSFYHPDLAQDARFADLMPQLQLIFQHIEKAYLVLVHHESRMKYDRNIPGAFRSATEYI